MQQIFFVSSKIKLIEKIYSEVNYKAMTWPFIEKKILVAYFYLFFVHFHRQK